MMNLLGLSQIANCFCYYTVITSLLHIITSFIITYHYIFCYCTVKKVETLSVCLTQTQ